MTDKPRNAFELYCKSQNPAYKPTDDGVSNRRDWSIWQAATKQGKRQPLSVEQLFANVDLMALNAEHGMLMPNIVKIVRVIEAAHGITATPQGTRQPPYPEGEVIGPCVCGSWPGGKCLKCPWISTTAAQGKI